MSGRPEAEFQAFQCGGGAAGTRGNIGGRMPWGLNIAGPPSGRRPAMGGVAPSTSGAAAADAEAAGGAVPGTLQVTFPKRDALWKFPCPRMADQATPELFFIA